MAVQSQLYGLVAHEAYLRGLQDADKSLAPFLGPLHPARQALRELTEKAALQKPAEATAGE
ncbi:MAG TPA: hypothetical protein VHB45_13075 [Alloacidobacterium sp.]|nr:hypothetical protein [Alloacidobacterium sp.]